jgi:hypothetical protein
MTEGKEQGKKIAQLISKAWHDESFKARLLSDTMTVMKEYGIAVPEDVTIKAVENTDKMFYLVIPSKPDGELTDEDMTKVDTLGGSWRGPDRRVVRVDFNSWSVVASNLLKRKSFKRE